MRFQVSAEWMQATGRGYEATIFEIDPRPACTAVFQLPEGGTRTFYELQTPQGLWTVADFRGKVVA